MAKQIMLSLAEECLICNIDSTEFVELPCKCSSCRLCPLCYVNCYCVPGKEKIVCMVCKVAFLPLNSISLPPATVGPDVPEENVDYGDEWNDFGDVNRACWICLMNLLMIFPFFFFKESSHNPKDSQVQVIVLLPLSVSQACSHPLERNLFLQLTSVRRRYGHDWWFLSSFFQQTKSSPKVLRRS